MRRVIILMTVLIFVSCNKKNHIPSSVIKPAQMQNILWDMIRADILAQEIIKKDSSQNLKSASLAIAEKVFAIHKTDQAKFKKSIDFYEKHPALLKAIFDSINAIQTRNRFKNIVKEKKFRNSNKFSPGKLVQ
jgi:hypothetical protein